MVSVVLIAPDIPCVFPHHDSSLKSEQGISLPSACRSFLHGCRANTLCWPHVAPTIVLLKCTRVGYLALVAVPLVNEAKAVQGKPGTGPESGDVPDT